MTAGCTRISSPEIEESSIHIHSFTHLALFETMPTVHLLDYVAGNVRSLVNAIEKVGYTVAWVKTPADVPAAEVRYALSTTMRTSIDSR
jgi:hypothetical protein